MKITDSRRSPFTERRPIMGSWDCCWLDGRPLSTADDWLEVLANDSLAAVRGAYALAWRDPDQPDTVSLARDAIGERTLYFAADRAGVTLGRTVSEVLAQRDAPVRLDLAALATYACLSYIPAPMTLVEDVRALPAGERLRVRGGIVKRERVWNAPAEQPDTDPSVARAQLRTTLERSVTRRLPDPGRQLSASLSGGVDSSLVVALARRMHAGPMTAFSLGFGDGQPNELEHSALVAAHCGVEHQVINIVPQDVVRELDPTMSALGSPIGDPLTVPNAMLFRQAGSVVFNGEGGDPCFGGPKNVPMLLHALYRVAGDHDDLATAYLQAHRRGYEDLAEMLTTDVLAELPVGFLESLVRPQLVDQRWTTLTNRMMALNVTLKCADHILAKVDALSRAAGVTPRSPLCDRDVVEMALRLPATLKLVGSDEKHLLKLAIADLVPASILNRPKSGMRVPVVSWLSGPLLPYTRERLLDGLAPRGIVRKDYIERLLGGDDMPIRRRWLKLWMLLSLEAWLDGLRRR